MPYALAANVSVHHAPCVLVLAKVCLDGCVNTVCINKCSCTSYISERLIQRLRLLEKGRAIFTPLSQQSPSLYYESLSSQLVEPEFQSQQPH